VRPVRPLLAAAGITAVVGVAGALGVCLVLAVIGCTMHGSDLDSSSLALQASGGSPDLTTGTGATPDDPLAVALLSRAARAATDLRYDGMTRGAAGADLVRVSNLPGVGTVVSRPGMAALLAGSGQPLTLADDGRLLTLLASNYGVNRDQAADRAIAGRQTVAVDARRSDHSLAARFWLDKDTGLLLRRDLFGATGDAITSTEFTELWLHRRLPTHLPPLASSAWNQTLDSAALTAQRDAGCTCETSLPGGLELLAARLSPATSTAPAGAVVQLLYSDGLLEFSIFDQRGQLDPQAQNILLQEGFNIAWYDGVSVIQRVTTSDNGRGEWVWQATSSVVTLVGPSAPTELVEQRVDALVAATAPAPQSTERDGPMEWIQRGWSRVSGSVASSWHQASVSTAGSHVHGLE
jgi:hypothetical protein